jgi:hypothetical protein
MPGYSNLSLGQPVLGTGEFILYFIYYQINKSLLVFQPLKLETALLYKLLKLADDWLFKRSQKVDLLLVPFRS